MLFTTSSVQSIVYCKFSSLGDVYGLADCIQSNFNGSKTFGTMKICSRQGYFELMSVNHLFNMKVY